MRGKEMRPAEKESQLAGAASCREEQKKHCGNVHNGYGIPLIPYIIQNNRKIRFRMIK